MDFKMKFVRRLQSTDNRDGPTAPWATWPPGNSPRPRPGSVEPIGHRNSHNPWTRNGQRLTGICSSISGGPVFGEDPIWQQNAAGLIPTFHALLSLLTRFECQKVRSSNLQRYNHGLACTPLVLLSNLSPTLAFAKISNDTISDQAEPSQVKRNFCAGGSGTQEEARRKRRRKRDRSDIAMRRRKRDRSDIAKSGDFSACP